MAKPWGALRISTRPPIGAGEWRTSRKDGPRIHLKEIYDGSEGRQAGLGFAGIISELTTQFFTAADLRELIEFCAELAEQLDGK